MHDDEHLRTAVASLLYSKIATPGFVSRTGARGFLRLTSSRSRIGGGLATPGTVSGGLRFSVGDRLVVIERTVEGYRVLVRARVASEVVVLYDEQHADAESVAPALLDVLGTTPV